MRSLSVQVQPSRSPEIDMERVCSIFESIAAMSELVEHHAFENGSDGVPYFNFTFGTRYAKQLWQTIQEVVFDNPEFGAFVKKSSIVACSSESGWETYFLLAHFDSKVRVVIPPFLATVRSREG